MGPYLDDARFPLVVVRYPAQLEPADVPRLYAAWDAALARGPHAALIDLRLLEPRFAGPRMRKLAADEVERRRAVFSQRLIAEARVIPHPVVRTAAMAFDLVQGITFKRPLANFATFPEAERWLVELLGARGMVA